MITKVCTRSLRNLVRLYNLGIMLLLIVLNYGCEVKKEYEYKFQNPELSTEERVMIW